MYLAGPDAEAAARWLFTANLDREPGTVVYTCSLNSRGGVETDCTVIPLQEGVGTLVGPVLKVSDKNKSGIYFNYVFRVKVII